MAGRGEQRVQQQREQRGGPRRPAAAAAGCSGRCRGRSARQGCWRQSGNESGTVPTLITRLMRTPARITGSALGSSTRTRRWHGVMPIPRAASRRAGETLRSPSYVFRTMGSSDASHSASTAGRFANAEHRQRKCQHGQRRHGIADIEDLHQAVRPAAHAGPAQRDARRHAGEERHGHRDRDQTQVIAHVVEQAFVILMDHIHANPRDQTGQRGGNDTAPGQRPDGLLRHIPLSNAGGGTMRFRRHFPKAETKGPAVVRMGARRGPVQIALLAMTGTIAGGRTCGCHAKEAGQPCEGDSRDAAVGCESPGSGRNRIAPIRLGQWRRLVSL